MNRRPALLDVLAGPLYGLMLLVSAAVLLRGHHAPGGGFIGGLLAVAASVLWAIARGHDAARRRMPLGSPVRLAALGVLLALASGLPAWWQGQAFLTHQWAVLPLGVTRLHLSTVLLFDLGVHLAVWGALGGYALALLGSDEAADDLPAPPGEGLR